MTIPARVHFFDILSALPGAKVPLTQKPGPAKSWSPNTLKIRIALNYKRIPYTQSYITLPDIEPLLKSLAISAHAPGTAPKPYTLPAIVHPSLKSDSNPSGALNDSVPIALHLDEVFPAPEYPTLFPNGQSSYALAIAVNELMRNVVFAGYALLVARIADILDEPRGKEYFIQTRSESLGKPLSEVRPTDQGEAARLVEEMKNKMGVIVQMLQAGGKKKAGPFFEGDQPALADFIFQAFMLWLVAVGNGEVRALWDAVYPWVDGQGEEVVWDVPQ
ncbi:hypothetical protein BJX68DRAFT_259539 [Aspergillus pseudodeflectus]|uniref:GST N-terminal domain-containing protein n=1 Tax=Aspergillus pseudodeflectus TaxID=176178 RepID=A0ABR4JDF3_9EURO